MELLSDLKMLYHLAAKPVRGASHAARLETFYAGQAPATTGFASGCCRAGGSCGTRSPSRAGGIWVDMGGGTGQNLEYFGSASANSQGVRRRPVARRCWTSPGSGSSTTAGPTWNWSRPMRRATSPPTARWTW